MTPYMIYVFALTAAYIVYYGYHVSKDLYGKRSQGNGSEEELVISMTDSGITATPVREVAGGFAVGKEAGNSAGEAGQGTQRAPQETQKADSARQGSTHNDGSHDGNGGGTGEVSVRFVDRMTGSLDEAAIACEGGVPSDALIGMMVDERSSVLTFRKTTIRQERERV